MKWPLIFIGFTLIFFSCRNDSSKSAESKAPEEYLNVPGPIIFNGKSYTLGLSRHPSNVQYKQQYFLPGENEMNYTDMFFLELGLGNLDMQALAMIKAKEVNDRNNDDPIAAYNVGEYKEQNEVLLDFILSQGDADMNKIAQWSIYRYKAYSDAQGHKGIVAFGRSRRSSYGPAYKDFAKDLKTNRKDYVLPFMKLAYPEVRLK